jgi:site-specific DNA-methyltransferase (adenine-specific)
MKLILGDSLERLKDLPTSTIDAIVTDPPYGWRFMGKAWDGADIEKTIASKIRKTPAPGRNSMSDNRAFAAGEYNFSSEGNQSFMFWTSDWAREAFRVLKPGGHMLVFCGPRTYHAMAMGVEMAGFEIRDQLQWLFGSGFPKSLDVSKAIDKAAGAEREVVGENPNHRGESQMRNPFTKALGQDGSLTAPSTDAAKQWKGWGTALKPANEPIVLARKPLEKGLTVAQNVQKWGTGALNIDGTRIGPPQNTKVKFASNADAKKTMGAFEGWDGTYRDQTQGRWPANVLFDEEAAAMLDEQSGVSKNQVRKISATEDTSIKNKIYGKGYVRQAGGANDSGGASRFFYVAKASKSERNAGCEFNGHPTVKPIKLMEYLCRLVTPPGGIILDPFMGSGTTGCAAAKLGYQFIGIEREQEYIEIARKRIEHWKNQAGEREDDDGQIPLPLEGK